MAAWFAGAGVYDGIGVVPTLHCFCRNESAVGIHIYMSQLLIESVWPHVLDFYLRRNICRRLWRRGVVVAVLAEQ